MLCDTSEASCSDCKMEIVRNHWTAILIKWLNKCVHPNKVCKTLTPICLADIMNKYKNDIYDDDIDRAILCTDDIEPFIRYKYPILRLRYLSEDGDYEKKQYIMTSVLLFHCCIKSRSGIVHEDIWKYMTKYEQEVILKFCERLDDMEITVNNVDCAVKEAFDYVKYVQNLSNNDMEPHTSEDHVNTAVETEKTPVNTSSEKTKTLSFNSSVTVLPSAITDTSTFSSLVTEGEESTSSFDQSLNNTDSEEIGSYRAIEHAEGKRQRKPYRRGSHASEGSFVYKIPEEKSQNKARNVVQKAGLIVRKDKPEEYTQSRSGKRGPLGRKQEKVLYRQREQVLYRNREEELVSNEIEILADDKKHEFAPIRHENFTRVRRSNEEERTPKLCEAQPKNKEFTARTRDFTKCEKVKRYDERGRLHEQSRETRVKQEHSNEEGDTDEIKSAKTKHAVCMEDSSVKGTPVEIDSTESCSCSYWSNASKDPNDANEAIMRSCEYTNSTASKTPAEREESNHKPSCEDVNSTVSKTPAEREESNLMRDQGPKKQKWMNKACKCLSKSVQDIQVDVQPQEKAKRAWCLAKKNKYYILAAAALLLLVLLIPTLVFAQKGIIPFHSTSEEKKKEKLYYSDRRDISTDTPYQQKHTWICKNKICQIVYNDSYNDTTHSSLSRCNLLCMGPQFWPYPTGHISYSNEIVALATNRLEYKFQSIPSEAVHQYLGEAFKLFISDLERLESVDDGASKNPTEDLTVKKIYIQMDVQTDPEPRLKINTEESYNLTIDTVNNIIEVKVSSASFCGVRHGLQTLSQMILLDQTSGKLITVSKARIKDAPTFKYRGLMIDTARNYIPVEDLIRTIDAMGTVKLNTFHWRISDVTSFPLYLQSIPMLFEYGAYTRSMIYTKEDVKFVVERAGIRGIRVLIEIAAPGPVGRAWSWHPGVNCPAISSENVTCDNVLCLRFGLKDSIMDALLIIYSEILEMTNVDDIFHLSDGVFSLSNCYSLIEDRKGFLSMALNQLKAANKGTLPKLPIIWQSPHLKLYLEAKTWDRLGVQVTEMPNDQAGSLSKFQVIHSTKWDLSCEIKKHRCTRYRTWQEMYSWKSWRNIEVLAIEGGEALLWTDVVNSGNLDSHLWPRAAAVAERLWSDSVANTSVSGPLYIRLDNQRFGIF